MAPDGTEIERLAPPKEPEYDFARINREVQELQSYDTAWNSWFDAQGIEPLRIGYETLSANPAAALIRICPMRPPAPAMASFSGICSG